MYWKLVGLSGPAASTLTPGPRISGFRTKLLIVLGQDGDGLRQSSPSARAIAWDRGQRLHRPSTSAPRRRGHIPRRLRRLLRSSLLIQASFRLKESRPSRRYHKRYSSSQTGCVLRFLSGLAGIRRPSL